MQTPTRSFRLPTLRNLGYSFNWAGRIGLTVILFWALVAAFGSLVAPHPPGE